MRHFPCRLGPKLFDFTRKVPADRLDLRCKPTKKPREDSGVDTRSRRALKGGELLEVDISWRQVEDRPPDLVVESAVLLGIEPEPSPVSSTGRLAAAT